MTTDGTTRHAMRPALLVAVAVLAIYPTVVCLPTPAWGADNLEARRREVAAMSPAEKQELLRKQERFQALPEEEQNRLRTLQAAIDADPKADRLSQVLAGYHEWLKTRSPGDRAELAKMSREDRVDEIRRSVRYQEITRRLAENFELLTERDMRNILDWIEDLLWSQHQRLIASMPPPMRSWLERQSEDRQRRALLHFAVGQARHRGDRKSRVTITQQDIQRLSQRLSDEAQAELRKRVTLEDKRRLVGGWVFSSINERHDYGRSSRRSTPLPEADVADFFEKELSPDTRERLMSMPLSKAREELRHMYWRRDRGESIFRGGPGGPRPDRRRRDGFDRGRRPPGGKSFDDRRGAPRAPERPAPGPADGLGESDDAGSPSDAQPEF